MNLGAPDRWNARRDGPCGHLWVRISGNAERGDGFCESAWEPTPEELTSIPQGGHVVLRVFGWQPAVAIYVERPDFEIGDREERVK